MKFSLLTSVSSAALGAGLLMGSSGSAHAGATSYYTNGDTGVTLNTTVSAIGAITIPKFVPGTDQVLTSVVIVEGADVAANGGHLTNTLEGTGTTNYTVGFNSHFTITRGAGAPASFPIFSAQQIEPQTTFSLAAGATKSPINLAGTYTSPAVTLTSGLSAFTSATPSNFTIDFSGRGKLTVSGGNESSKLTGSGIGFVTITYNYKTTTPAVPEPASLAILGAGLAGMGVIRRRRKA